MRSIREWLVDKGLVGEEFDRNAFAQYMDSNPVKIDRGLEMELRSKVRRIMDIDKFRSMPAEDLLDRMKAVISQTVAGMSGSFLGTRAAAKNLGSDEGEKVDATRFARMMGGEKVEVDAKLRRELKPKIEGIMYENNKKENPLPKAELERELIAVVSKLVAGMSGTTISAGDLERRLDTPVEEPIAKEESVVPSFLRWAEENEGSVSEPQHKQGEVNMDLKAVVEKRMMQIAMELETDGKGSRQEVLAAMKAVVDTAQKEEPKPDATAQQAPPQQGTDPSQVPMPPADQPPMPPQA
jgi:hypothetical protein